MIASKVPEEGEGPIRKLSGEDLHPLPAVLAARGLGEPTYSKDTVRLKDNTGVEYQIGKKTLSLPGSLTDEKFFAEVLDPHGVWVPMHPKLFRKLVDDINSENEGSISLLSVGGSDASKLEADDKRSALERLGLLKGQGGPGKQEVHLKEISVEMKIRKIGEHYSHQNTINNRGSFAIFNGFVDAVGFHHHLLDRAPPDIDESTRGEFVDLVPFYQSFVSKNHEVLGIRNVTLHEVSEVVRHYVGLRMRKIPEGEPTPPVQEMVGWVKETVEVKKNEHRIRDSIGAEMICDSVGEAIAYSSDLTGRKISSDDMGSMVGFREIQEVEGV
ncbi:MAG: hypothetical protein V1744_03150, partial [Candidatus Altiarchaeota archaeon]